MDNKAAIQTEFMGVVVFRMSATELTLETAHVLKSIGSRDTAEILLALASTPVEAQKC